jgi:hypothetical protein
LSRRNPPTSAREFLSQSLSLISFSTQKFFASQVLCTWLAVSQGSAQADQIRFLASGADDLIDGTETPAKKPAKRRTRQMDNEV